MGRKKKVHRASVNADKDDAHLGGANLGTMNFVLNTIPPIPDGFQPNRKKAKVKDDQFVRRSDRIRTSESTNRGQKVKTPSAHVDTVDIEMDDGPGNDHISTSPVFHEINAEEALVKIQNCFTLPVVGDGNVEREVHFLVQEVDEIRSQCMKHVTGNPRDDGVPSNLSYEDLYINSRKKIEALMEKHYELVRKLEFANGKIDVYEKIFGDSDEVVSLLSPLKYSRRKKMEARSPRR